VTFDAAISNELFYADHNAMRLDAVTVTAPDGSVDKIQNASTGKYRSTFDVQLTKPGTYKIGSASSTVMASWTESGEVKRFRGSPDDFAKQVPAGAADLKTIKSFNRNETFVTRDAPTDPVFKPTGKGLELVAGDPPQRPGGGRGGDLQVPARRQAGRRPGSDLRARQLALPRHARRLQGQDRRRRVVQGHLPGGRHVLAERHGAHGRDRPSRPRRPRRRDGRRHGRRRGGAAPGGGRLLRPRPWPATA
jgi:hypothetical protein